MKHTPGPWKAEGFEVYADDDCVLHAIADCSCNHTCRLEPEQEANARLIAAAPDMYEALKAVADADSQELADGTSDVWSKVAAALQKAILT